MDFYDLMNKSGKLTPEEYSNLHKYLDTDKLIVAACKLKFQLIEPAREGMIDALKSSLKIAYQEIRQSETDCNPSCEFPQYVQFEQLSNEQLYSLLSIYLKGLEQHCLNKFGKELYEKCLKTVWQYAIEN